MTSGTLFVLLLPLAAAQTAPAAAPPAQAEEGTNASEPAPTVTVDDEPEAEAPPETAADETDEGDAPGDAGAPSTPFEPVKTHSAAPSVPAPPVPAKGRASRGPVRQLPLGQATSAPPKMTVEQSEAPPVAVAEADDDTPLFKGGQEQPGLEPPKWWGLGITLAASTKNLGPSFKLRYLWVMESQFGTDYLLTSALNGLSLDDLDAFRFTANTTVGFRLRPWPFSLDMRHVPAPLGPWPDLVFGVGGWSVMELDHVLQIFRQGDAGVFGGASIGGFLTLAFRDVTISLLFRPLGITAYWLHGQIDSTPFTLGNPILDVNLSWTLPL